MSFAMRRACGAALLVVLTLGVELSSAQSTHAPPQPVQSRHEKPKNEAFKQAVADFFAQRSQLQQQADSAFKREMARKKAGDCPNARTTYAEETCLGNAIKDSEANYQSFSGAIRALLGQKNPLVTNTEAFVGPSGKPLSAESLVKEFDQAETAWQTYRKTQCSAAYDLFKGGSIAPVMEEICELGLIRSRMTDLNSIYDMTLRH